MRTLAELGFLNDTEWLNLATLVDQREDVTRAEFFEWRAHDQTKAGLLMVIAKQRTRQTIRASVCPLCSTPLIRLKCYREDCYEDFTTEGDGFVRAAREEVPRISTKGL